LREEIFADADKVGVRATLRGISSAAGREVTVREIQIYRIADGHIAERWFVVDRTNLQCALVRETLLEMRWRTSPPRSALGQVLDRKAGRG
jgi:hypothetical protein